MESILNIKDKYNPDKILWVQEEPENMGAWSYILSNLVDLLDIDLISRPSSASPASGSSKNSTHKQNQIINKVFK